MKNRLLYILSTTLLLMCSSCNDWDLNMKSTKPNYSGEGEAAIIRGQLITSYNLFLSGNIFGENYWGNVGCIDTDEGFRSNVSSNANILNAHNITTSSNQLTNFWKTIWQSNEAATDVLSMLKTVNDMSANEMDEIKGQALVLQAFCHYYATINFGPIPLKDVATFDMKDGELERKPVKEILQFCLDNCRLAIPLLPDITTTKTTAKITKSAAEALSYRIALYMASHPDIKDSDKYDQIVKWADEFIANGPNKLNTKTIVVNGEELPAYARLFVNNMADNQDWDPINNPEGIWDIVFYCKSTTSGIYANLGYEANMRLGRDMGLPCADDHTSSAIGFADITFRASNNLYNSYTDFNNGKDYPIGDLRRDWNIPTFCYKYKSTDNIAEGYSLKSRFPYFEVIMPQNIKCDKPATLLPLFDKSSWNNSDNAATLLDIYVENGGSGYKNEVGESTFSFVIPKFTGTSMKFVDKTKGAVVGYASGANIDKKASGYQTINAKNASTDMLVTVENGSIVSIARNTNTSPNIGTGFTCVHARGIGKWRREYEVNVPSAREKDKTSCNMPVLRFADVLLIAAEAHLMSAQGNKAKGLEYLNMVRRRAYGKDIYTPNTQIDFKELTLKVVKEERLRELCFEGLRRFDLLRWGAYTVAGSENVISQFVNANPNHTNINYPILKMRDEFTKYQTLPLPDAEISNSPNTMWQNPGW